MTNQTPLTNFEKAAKLLEEHADMTDRSATDGCACGYPDPRTVTYHQAQELANAGLLARPLPDREKLAKVIRDAIHGNPLTATFQMDLDAADAVLALLKEKSQ